MHRWVPGTVLGTENMMIEKKTKKSHPREAWNLMVKKDSQTITQEGMVKFYEEEGALSEAQSSLGYQETFLKKQLVNRDLKDK